MKIQVTQEHINAGKQHSSTSCPVALALKDAFPQEKISVGYHTVINWPRGRATIDIPPEVTESIISFDAIKQMEPFEFEFDPGW